MENAVKLEWREAERAGRVLVSAEAKSTQLAAERRRTDGELRTWWEEEEKLPLPSHGRLGTAVVLRLGE